MRNRKVLTIISLLILLLFVAACGAQPTPETVIEKVVETVVVEKEVAGETVVETVVVEKEVEKVVTATPEPVVEQEPITLTIWDFKSG
ncbi:MAG: hypothetical protein GY770_27735, partial [Aestuariibacter sp.]|nr:hypothetical protein [Aestuariibacter sp.]